MAGATETSGTKSGCQTPGSSVHPHAMVPSNKLRSALPAAHGQSPVPQACTKPRHFHDFRSARCPIAPPTSRHAPAEATA